jgi:hypothetical protein
METLLTILRVIVTGVLGAIVLSAVVATHYAIFEASPPSGEGQYILVYVLSLPVGFLLGGTFGFASQCRSTNRRKYVLLIVGMISTLFVISVAALSSTTRETSLLEFSATIASSWCLAPLIASFGALVGGILLKHEGEEK